MPWIKRNQEVLMEDHAEQDHQPGLMIVLVDQVVTSRVVMLHTVTLETLGKEEKVGGTGQEMDLKVIWGRTEDFPILGRMEERVMKDNAMKGTEMTEIGIGLEIGEKGMIEEIEMTEDTETTKEIKMIKETTEEIGTEMLVGEMEVEETEMTEVGIKTEIEIEEGGGTNQKR